MRKQKKKKKEKKGTVRKCRSMESSDRDLFFNNAIKLALRQIAERDCENGSVPVGRMRKRCQAGERDRNDKRSKKFECVFPGNDRGEEASRRRGGGQETDTCVRANARKTGSVAYIDESSHSPTARPTGSAEFHHFSAIARMQFI